jgi:hypothetical protein
MNIKASGLLKITNNVFEQFCTPLEYTVTLMLHVGTQYELCMLVQWYLMGNTELRLLGENSVIERGCLFLFLQSIY